MTILRVLHILIAILTIGTGLISLIRPRSVMGFTGLIVPGARGITEIRAILGGTFIGLGAAPLILAAQPAYQALGIVYLAIAASRTIGLVLDRSFERSNWISLATEVLMGILLLL